jgi:S-DNA-T family DNA segregation ATPase FtsK/SpoIIIE
MKPLHFAMSPTRIRPLNVFLGLVLTLVSLLLLMALATYHSSDPSLNTAASLLAPQNWIGLFGAWLSDLLLQAFGVTAFLMPLWLAGLGWSWMRSRSGGSVFLRLIGSLLALAFVPAAFALLPWHMLWLHAVPVEGVVGRLIAGLMVSYLNRQGTWLVTSVLAAAGLYFASAVSVRAVLEAVEDRWLTVVEWHDRWRNWREDRAELRAERLAEHAQDQDGQESLRRPGRLAALFGRRGHASESTLIDEVPAYQRGSFQPPEDEVPIATPVRRPGARNNIWERAVAEPEPEPVEPIALPDNVTPIRPQAAPPPARTMSARPAAFQFDQEPPAAAPRRDPEIAIGGRADSEVRTATVAPKNVSGFKLPPSTLLNPGDGPQKIREEELREEAKVLVEKCGEFDVRGQVVQINPGPMVTTYEFKPEAGVKYSRVTGLADDLCLAMRAESILIERMAGKSTVGIQVPNHERETIHLRDVIESEPFHKAKSRLTLAMGKDINGRIVTADLASMPHVLIAGSTGSGKSVAINAMIMSLLFRTTPSQVRLILVDPKRVELGMYEGIPHLFTPIITEPKLAANALRNAVREMERRLKLLASRSVRNIDQYNKLFDGAMPSLFDDGEEEAPLPYIVIIIDELADLMMLDRANVEESITRLAQMARAVGIHLILATQRPSVDVITGLIKANVPTRISFRLATKVDSRTILDTNGAEALLGRGDMLFLPPGSARLTRLHAPFVSEKETAAVVDFWKAQGQAEYVQGFLESPRDERPSGDGSNSDPDENDTLFDDAVRLVFEFGKASTSLLQRRLRIGYGRAAHLIDLMERDGLVGPADGSRPRELLKAPGWLHEISSTANE